MDTRTSECIDGEVNVERLTYDVFSSFRKAAWNDLQWKYRLQTHDIEDVLSDAYLRFRDYVPKWIMNKQDVGINTDRAFLYLGKAFRWFCSREARKLKITKAFLVEEEALEKNGIAVIQARTWASQEVYCDAQKMVNSLLSLTNIQQRIIFAMADGLTLGQIAEEFGEDESCLRKERTVALACLHRVAGTSLHSCLLEMKGKKRVLGKT